MSNNQMLDREIKHLKKEVNKLRSAVFEILPKLNCCVCGALSSSFQERELIFSTDMCIECYAEILERWEFDE